MVANHLSKNQSSNQKIYLDKIKYLQNYFWIIQNLLDELIRNKEDSFIKASQISGMPKSQMIRTIDDIYIEKKAREKRIDRNIDKLYNKKQEIENTINNLQDPQQKYVLKNKYLFFKTIEEISINLDKSRKQISRWHTDAINNLELPDYISVKINN